MNKLAAYLEETHRSYSEFARSAGTRHARTIERIAKGQKRAGPKMIRGIVEASGGVITANDLLGIDPPNPESCQAKAEAE